MKKFALVCGILASVVSVGFAVENTYREWQDYYNDKKYYEMGCNNGNVALLQMASCVLLADIYIKGESVRQDTAKGLELLKKACGLLAYGYACNRLGDIYSDNKLFIDKEVEVEQDKSIAKEYYGKACDLGYQRGCDDYRTLNQQGVR